MHSADKNSSTPFHEQQNKQENPMRARSVTSHHATFAHVLDIQVLGGYFHIGRTQLKQRGIGQTDQRSTDFAVCELNNRG